MAYKFRSSDGLMQTNDPQHLGIWESIAAKQASEYTRADELLRAKGVKLEHPDDGWVNREQNHVTPCYPRFDLRPGVGDLIALGWPWEGYRIVRVTKIEDRRLSGARRHWFEETGEHVDSVRLS